MDQYSFNNCYDRILWRPGHPLFQKELNEFQSGRLMDQRILTDRVIPEGTILSGMGVTSLGNTSNEDLSDGTNKNLFKFTGNTPDNNNTNLSTINGDITDTVETYNRSGEIDFTSTATADDQKTGLDVFYHLPVDSNNDVTNYTTTLSFDVENSGGTNTGVLNNLSVIPVGGSKITNATIDGYQVADDITNNASNNIHVIVNGNKEVHDIGDGNYHQVVVTFDNTNVGDKEAEFDLLFNNGFSALMGTNVRINHMKVEQGSNVTAWESSDTDKGTNGSRDYAINVSSGSLYLDGQPRVFNNQTINIQGIGAEQVGAKVVHDIVTPNQDHNLNDNTPGAEDENAAGADREHYTVKLTYGTKDTDAVIFYFQNGHLVANADSNQYDKLNSVLATRTYEQSGSFLSWGMGLTSHPDKYDSDKIDIQIGEGAAYVLGHRIYTSGTQTVQVPIENSTYDDENDVDTFRINPNGISSNYIIPSIQPMALKQDNSQDRDSSFGLSIWGNEQKTLTGSLDGSDGTVSFDSVIPGTSVMTGNIYAESNGKKYYPTSYGFMQTDNGISARITDSHFLASYGGGQVKADCTIYRPFVEDGRNMPDSLTAKVPEGTEPDYQLICIQNGKVKPISEHDPNDPNEKVAIDFNKSDDPNLSGDMPNNGTQVSINYQAYDSRDDLIILNANGTFHDVQGQPGLADQIQPPVNNSTNANQALSIGTVHIYPNCQQATVQMATIPSIPFSGLNDMALQINSLQENMAILAARQASISGSDPATLKDTFSDFFVNQDKADITNNYFNIEYSKDGYITPGPAAEGTLPISQVNGSARTGSKTIETNYSEVPFIRQSNETDVLPLNRTKLLCHKANMVCDPSTIHQHYTDNVIWDPAKLKTLSAHEAQADANDLLGGLHTKGDHNALADMGLSQTDLENLAANSSNGSNGYENTYGSGTVLHGHTTHLDKGTYLASQWIHIQADGFMPNANNLQVHLVSFNNLPCEVTCQSSILLEDPSVLGSQNVQDYTTDENVDPYHYNAVKADNVGNVSCWFKIPKNIVPNGLLTVKLSNPQGDFAIDRIDATAPVEVTHNVATNLYINNDTLINNNSYANSLAVDMINNQLHAIDDSLSDISQYDSSASSAISNLNVNVQGNIFSLESLAPATDSLSDAITDLSNKTSLMSTAQSYDNQENSEAISALNNGVETNDSLIGENSRDIQSNSSEIQSAADSLGATALSIADRVTDDESNFNSAIVSDENTIYENSYKDSSEAMSLQSELDTNTAAMVNLHNQNQNHIASVAASAFNEADALNNNINGVQNNLNTDVTDQNNINYGFNGRINTAHKAANFADVAAYDKNGHMLALREFTALGGNTGTNTSTRSHISVTALNEFFNSANSSDLCSQSYPYPGGQWPGVANEAFNQAMRTGSIVLPGKGSAPGQAWSMITCIPANTNWYEYNGNHNINGQGMVTKINSNYVRTNGPASTLRSRILNSIVGFQSKPAKKKHSRRNRHSRRYNYAKDLIGKYPKKLHSFKIHFGFI